MLGCNHSRSGSGFDDSDRKLPGGLNGGNPTGGKHYKQFAFKAERFQTRGKLGQVFGSNRFDIRVGCRGAGSLIFADLGQDFK